MSEFKKLAQMFNLPEKAVNAEKVLDRIDRPEIATFLSGDAKGEYLQALDQIYGNKNNRMKNMGFGDKTHYIGSPNANIEKFDKTQNSLTKGPGTKNYQFTTDNPEVANTYTTTDELLTPKDPKIRNQYYNLIERGVPYKEADLLQNPGMVYPVKLRENNMVEVPTPVNQKEYTNLRENFDSNINDSPDRIKIPDVADTKSFQNIKSEINMLKDPTAIRSVNAAFDPRFKDSANILAMDGSQPKIPGLMDTLKQAGGDISGIASNLYKDSALEKADNLRSQALDKIINATDIARNVPEADTTSAKEYGKTGLDFILPDTTDLLPLGRFGKLSSMAAKEGKLLKFPKQAEKTAEELMQGVRKAESADLKLGSNLVNKPVLKTTEELAADKLPGAFGKVSTPDMPSISHNEIMDFLNNSPSYQKHIADRNLFKTNPEAYADKKDFFINKAKEFLSKRK